MCFIWLEQPSEASETKIQLPGMEEEVSNLRQVIRIWGTNLVCRIGHHDHRTSTTLTSTCGEYMNDLVYEHTVDTHRQFVTLFIWPYASMPERLCCITHVVEQAYIYIVYSKYILKLRADSLNVCYSSESPCTGIEYHVFLQ